MRPVYQLNSELYKVTGIQRVMMDIHEALKPFGAKIIGTVPMEKVNKDLGINESDYIQFNGYGRLKGSVVIVHERRYLPIFWVLNKILRFDIELIYVHHNELYGQRLLSRFPKHVVAISDAGIKNLTEYFGVKREYISKIHNCVRKPDGFRAKRKEFNPEEITILYPARINSVKRQVEIVRNLRGKLSDKVRILFAGEGPEYEELQKECGDSTQFVALGFRADVPELMQQSDFMMLYSRHEGLPISLIEATMTGTPIICNNVGGNCEIAFDGRNALVPESWEELTQTLNLLPELSKETYASMSRASVEVYERYYRFEKFADGYRILIKQLECGHSRRSAQRNFPNPYI